LLGGVSGPAISNFTPPHRQLPRSNGISTSLFKFALSEDAPIFVESLSSSSESWAP
jgi:hypothetical protein